MLFYHHYIVVLNGLSPAHKMKPNGSVAFCAVACLLVISCTSCVAGAEALTMIVMICDKPLCHNTSMFLDPAWKHDSSLDTIQLLYCDYDPHLAWIQNDYSLYFLKHPASLGRIFFSHRKWRLSYTLSQGTDTVLGRYQQVSFIALQQSTSDLLRAWGSNNVALEVLKNQTQRSYRVIVMECNKVLWLGSVR